ncbi:DUF6456 domain-containing protein [Enterovirga sp.]|uniref:DUF6456 domain-containing protein n=1 Tax=Enterovirga sp. TaxID=2026350 RepID=UPI00260CEA6D|nr:DUF6456 domain-containing protein [Enterovirga sp.]MDB5590699.1 hypothetical protein [Enterovirga sp.]
MTRPSVSRRSPRIRPLGSALPPLSRPASRLLARLAEPGAAVASDPTRDGFVILQAPKAGMSLGRGSHPESALAELLSRDLVTRDGRGRAAISGVGRSHLKRLEGERDGAFLAQHRDLVRDEIRHETRGSERVVVNSGESPLAWLRRRRNRAGEPLIDAACFEAGERLRRDLTAAGLLPAITARWEGAVASGGGPRDPAGATDAVIAARQRARAALAAVGSDFANLLLDLCGFLKGLEAIERERGWPPRSGKVVLGLALRRLADHYGLETEARGPEGARRMRSWIADGEDAGAA